MTGGVDNRETPVELEEIAAEFETATILVVEDDEDTAEFLRTLLADAGYAVAVASNGNAALAQLE